MPLVGVLSLLLASPQEVSAQSNAWVEDASLLTAPKIAYAGPGTYYTEDLAIRSNQELLRFTMGSNCFFQVQVRVIAPYTGSWQTIYNGTCAFGNVGWSGVPTAPGTYRIEMKYLGIAGTWRPFTYDLFVVPAAQRAFRDGQWNSMILWAGTTSALDSPFLVVEGIDAENMNLPSLYYQLGLPLFTTGRQRGTDALILNFEDGGADMRLNAGVVQRAVLYLNQIKTGTRRLDVAGLSMGGVVVRYALAQMEVQGTLHNVQRFVSVDAPQRGAWLDASLQDYIRNELPSDNWPLNVTSMAGKQLLIYNALDATGNVHSQFYAELNALNGDGYPHWTTENVGVSFGTSAQNPHVNTEWLYVHDNVYAPLTIPPGRFHIEPLTTEGSGGSWLPSGVTDIWVKKYGYIEVEFERYTHPTFIPYTSALDIVNGQSRFAAPTIAPSTPGFHDRVPTDVVEPLLLRLGYPPLPLTAVISGPNTFMPGVPAEWRSTTTGGTPPYDSYLWEYLYVCSPPVPLPPCTGICTEGGDPVLDGGAGLGPTCDLWEYGGSGSTFTKALSGGGSGEVRIRLTVTDAGITSRRIKSVFQTGGALQAGGPADSTEAALAVAGEPYTAASTAPTAFALEGGIPNPFSQTTTLRFALPEAVEVRLAVYDVLGREVAVLAEGAMEAGQHVVPFDAAGLPGGTYLVRLQAGDAVQTQRLTLTR